MIKIIIILLISTPFIYSQECLESTQKVALDTHKNILLVFSGSDWCKPCIQMKKEIFEHPDFKKFEKDNVVIYNADFPYKRKNKLDKEQQKHNDNLAEKYNTSGIFPRVVLLDKNLNTLGIIQYNTGMDVSQFIGQIKNL